MTKKNCCLYPAFSILFLVALFFTLPFGLGLVFRDDDLVDTSALALKPRVIADEENSYFDFEKIIEEEVPVEVTDELERHLNGEKWDADFVESTLNDYDHLIETVESAAEKPFFQDPRTFNPEEGDYLDGIPTLHNIMTALRMNNLKAMSLMKEGKETEAFAQAYHSVTIGMQIEVSYGNLISYLIGNTAKKSGIETLALLIPETTDVDLLKTYSQKLAETYPSEENLVQTYTVEYHLMSSIFDLVDENPGELDPFMDNHLYGDLEEFLYPMFKTIGWNFYYHPNETRNLYYERMYGRPEEDTRLFPGTPISYFTENAIGLALVEGLTPRLDIYEGERWNEELLLIKTTQTEMVSQAYALDDEGALP